MISQDCCNGFYSNLFTLVIFNFLSGMNFAAKHWIEYKLQKSVLNYLHEPAKISSASLENPGWSMHSHTKEVLRCKSAIAKLNVIRVHILVETIFQNFILITVYVFNLAILVTSETRLKCLSVSKTTRRLPKLVLKKMIGLKETAEVRNVFLLLSSWNGCQQQLQHL